MGCRCGGKTAAELEALTPGVRYRTTGSQRTVKLGLKPRFTLPLKLSKAIDGRDVLVVTSKMKLPPLGDTIIIVGRNAQLKPEHKDQLKARWPHVFEDA